MSSGFVTEQELEEQRKLRQAEWEKVRNADEPIDAPDEPYDHRSLFDRLEEQKQKKQMEYEEAHKLKNMIKGLDDDEVDFLDLVDRKKIEAEQLKEMEEKEELKEFRKHVERLKEASIDERIIAEVKPTKPLTPSVTSQRSQQALLKGAVIKKKSNETQTTQNDKGCSMEVEGARGGLKRKREESEAMSVVGQTKESKTGGPGLTCVGILPGLGHYDDESSDSESSDSSIEAPLNRTKFDLLGRQLVLEAKETKQAS